MQYQNSPQNMSPSERLIFGTLGLGLIALAFRGHGQPRLPLAMIGGAFAFGAAAGKSPYNAVTNIRRTARNGIHVRKSVTIHRPAQDVYAHWRQLENLPEFMSHLERVTVADERTSHWVARGPGEAPYEWDAEITQDEPGRLIAWRSLPGAQIPNEGRVEFRPAPGERGTEVHVELQYHPPLGTLGAGVARWFGMEPSQEVESDLATLKRMLEAGMVPTITGQPSGREDRSLDRLIGKMVDNAGAQVSAQQPQARPAGRRRGGREGRHQA